LLSGSDVALSSDPLQNFTIVDGSGLGGAEDVS
jgi:hypothetical protein